MMAYLQMTCLDTTPRSILDTAQAQDTDGVQGSKPTVRQQDRAHPCFRELSMLEFDDSFFGGLVHDVRA